MAPRKPTNWWDDPTPTTVPGTKTTTKKPISDAELREVITKAEAARSRAVSAGVPEKTATEVLTTGQRPDAGFASLLPALSKIAGVVAAPFKAAGGIPLPGTAADVGDVTKAVGRGVAKVAKPVLAPPYRAYQQTYRFGLGVLKEADEELAVLGEKLPFVGGPKRGETLYYPKGEERGKAGFQWSEVMKVARDPNAGFGTTVFRDVTGNPYVDQTVGFLGEVFLDPVNALSAGVGGVAAKGLGKAAGLAPDAFKAAEAANDALRLQGKAALKLEAAKEALDAARATNVAADVKVAREAVSVAQKELSAATKGVLDPKAPRVRGRTGAAALGQRLVDLREEAQRVLDVSKDPVLGPTAGFSDEQLALAQYTVDTVTDELVARTASRGFAGLIPDLKAAFGAQTPAETLLGVTGRLRVGAGGRVVEIPGTERITRPITYGLQAGREALAGRVGIGAIVPTGEGGLFPRGLRETRAGLRTGELNPLEAVQGLELEQLDRAFRGQRVRFVRDSIATLARRGLTGTGPVRRKVGNVARALGKTVAPDAGYTRADLQSVLPLVTDPVARSAATLSPSQTKALEAIRGALDDFYEQARTVSGQTGRQLGFVPDYFPQMLSDQTLRAVRKGGQVARDVARNLRISTIEAAGNFTPRTLQVGDEFFGRVLTADDMRGGVVRLNEIATEGGFKGDFFETDVLSVLQKYANRHADDMARQTLLGQAPALAPRSFARILKEPSGPLATSWDPQKVVAGFATYADDVAANSGVEGASTIAASMADSLRSNLDSLQNSPAFAGLNDSDKLWLQDEYVREANLELNSRLFGLKDSAFETELKRFATTDEVMNSGFAALSDVAPDVAAGPYVQQLFDSVRTLSGDPGYAKRFMDWYRAQLGFVKAYQLATPRQVSLNLIGNYYMMTLAAGARTGNLLEGFRLHRRIVQLAKAGSPLEEAVQEAVRILRPKGGEIFTPATVDALRRQIAETYAIYGGTGFGRYGEIAAEVGDELGRPGIMQRGPARGVVLPGGAEIPGVTPATRGASRAVGALPRATRGAAQQVESSQRFQFVWDGIMQGLTPEEAAARAQFYLFDYQDLSKLDQAGRALFPYWMWMSRNTPLQMVLAAYNPRAYQFPEKFRRATEQAGAQEFGDENYEPLPAYQTERGAFVTKEMEGFGAPLSRRTVDLGLPIVGFGEKNFFTEFVNDYESGLLAPLSPAVRLPLELYSNRIAAFKSPLVYDNDSDPAAKRLEYAFRQSFGMPVSLFSRYVAAVPQARRQEFVQIAFDLRYDENQPGEQAAAAALRIMGLPVQPVPRTATKASVIKQNTRALEDYVNDREKARVGEEEKRIEDYLKNQGGTPNTGGTNWWENP